ncbi:MAG TPA: amidohydrolase family protein [Dehalococcoidales bacterium]
MVIDFHTHIVPLRIKQNRGNYAKADRGFASIFSDPKAKLATADDLIASMGKDGIDVSVVLNYGWKTQSLCVEINDYIMESIARFPRRLIGFCNVNLGAGDTALKELERCFRGGVKGIGEIRPDTISDSEKLIATIRPLAEFAVKNNLILLTHASEPVGHQYSGKGKSTPDLIYALITSFSDLKIVCAHWGGGLPFYALMPEVKQVMKNVYFDTAASPFLYTAQVYNQVAQMVGEDKILFGSDYPLIPQRRFLKEIRGLDLPEKIKDKILAGNAMKLLGITGK